MPSHTRRPRTASSHSSKKLVDIGEEVSVQFGIALMLRQRDELVWALSLSQQLSCQARKLALGATERPAGSDADKR